MTPLDVLIKARKMIEEPGRWARNNWFTRRKFGGRRMDCYCLDGALRIAAGAKKRDPNNVPRYFAYRDAAWIVDNVLRDDYGCYAGIVQWNDHMATDRRQVLRVLDKAIKRLQAAT